MGLRDFTLFDVIERNAQLHGERLAFVADGERISRFSGAPGGVLQAPHGLCVDAQGSIYVAEIGGPGRGQRLQKFARV